MQSEKQKNESKKDTAFPPQKQNHQPGKEYKMNPEPKCLPFNKGISKFEDQAVLISGSDSGINH